MKKKFMVTVLVLMLFSTFAWGSTTPVEDLKDAVDQIITLMKNPNYKKLSQRKVLKEKVWTISLTIFEYKNLARGALGKNWRRFNSQQRERFTELFAQLVFNTYFSKLTLDINSVKEIKILYTASNMLKTTKSGIKRARVKTVIHGSKNDILVDYMMLKTKSGLWKIYDVNIEGIGMVKNYRTQYQKKFSDSPEQLIEELKKKINTLKK